MLRVAALLFFIDYNLSAQDFFASQRQSWLKKAAQLKPQLIETGSKRCHSSVLDGMVQKGADTFWEVYDPNNEFLSPYNFYQVNSYCHAWSCTPVYFVRKYQEIFQD